MGWKDRISIEIDPGEIRDEILAWVAKHYDPDDVFDEKTLRDWALDNGFVESEE